DKQGCDPSRHSTALSETTPHVFEDRVSDIGCRPPTSAPDRNRAPGFRRRSLTVANVRQNGCQLGCQDHCLLPTHGPEPYVGRVPVCPAGSSSVLMCSISRAVVPGPSVSFWFRECVTHL